MWDNLTWVPENRACIPSPTSEELIFAPRAHASHNKMKHTTEQDGGDLGSSASSTELCDICRSIVDAVADLQPSELNDRPSGIAVERISQDAASKLSLDSACSLCRLLSLARVNVKDAGQQRSESIEEVQTVGQSQQQAREADWDHRQDRDDGVEKKGSGPSPSRSYYMVMALSFLRFTHGLNIGHALPDDQGGGLSDTIILAVVPAGTDCYEERDALKSHFWANGHIFVWHCCDVRMEKSWGRTAFVPREVTPFFDPEIARRWLDYCQSRHRGGNCQATTDNILPANYVRGLKLIDCYTRAIVAAPPGAPYVTLSYVWGSAAAKESVTGDLKSDPQQQQKVSSSGGALIGLSAVISDAIEATRMLGYDYLWVDRYCIDQTDPREVHSMVGKMDLIYSGSEVTIVAAAGRDESAGLPGMPGNSTPRQSYQRQHQINVSFRDTGLRLTILSCLPHPHYTVKQSKWISRGWTLQESVLARRLLIFTRDQVYFECKSMNCFESLENPLDTLHTGSGRRFRNFVRAGLFSGQDEGFTEVNIFGSPFGQWENVDGDWDNHFRKFLVFITSYCSRDLTFDSDSIRAFIGISRYIESSHSYMGHLTGIPYVWPVPGFGPSKSVDCLIAGLCWRHLAGPWPGVKEDSPFPRVVAQTRPRRRETFPSWTWAGWAGAVSWTDLFTHGEMDIISLVDDFRCELQQGHDGGTITTTTFSLPEYAKLRLTSNSVHDNEKKPPDVSALRFRAWVCSPGMLTLIETSAGPRWSIAGYLLELHVSLFNGSPSEFLQAVRSGTIRCVFVAKGLYNSYFLMLETTKKRAPLETGGGGRGGRTGSVFSGRRIGTAEAQWNQYQGRRGRVIDKRFADHVKFEIPKAELRVV